MYFYTIVETEGQQCHTKKRAQIHGNKDIKRRALSKQRVKPHSESDVVVLSNFDLLFPVV